jgi:ribosomal protein S1
MRKISNFDKKAINLSIKQLDNGERTPWEEVLEKLNK